MVIFGFVFYDFEELVIVGHEKDDFRVCYWLRMLAKSGSCYLVILIVWSVCFSRMMILWVSGIRILSNL
jgi:hypothetical protein